MYAVVNVEKFVKDNASRLGGRGEAILARAKELSENGVFSGGEIPQIMGDDALAREFNSVAMSDPEHIRIGLDDRDISNTLFYSVLPLRRLEGDLLSPRADGDFGVLADLAGDDFHRQWVENK